MKESRGISTAVGDNGQAVGILQMHPEVILDVNNIYGTDYSIEDRLDPFKSRAICVLYVTWYARQERTGIPPTEKEYALCWHYGPNFMKIEDRHKYWPSIQGSLKAM